MAHYQTANCWRAVLICKENHKHDPVDCTQSRLICDRDHIKKVNSERN